MAFCISSRCNLCWRRFTNDDEIQAVNARGDTITNMTFNPKEWQFYMNTHTFKACIGRCTHMGPNISFHTECYEKIRMDTKGLWHRYHMVSEAIHDFEPAIPQEKRRMEWFRSQVCNDVAMACAPFPQELRDIVVDYVAQDESHIIGNCTSTWNKAIDIYKKEDFGDVAGWKGMFVTYTTYEGVRYVETISNRRDKTSDRQVLVKPTSGPVDTIYVSHDHLGVRDVATCNSSGKQPIFHEEPGVWWNTISLAPGRCHLLWTRDSRKLRMLVQPDQAEENRRRRRPALWFTRVPTPEKFRFNPLTLLEEPTPHRYSPLRIGSRGLTGYSFQWSEGLRTILTHSDDPRDDRLYNLPKRRWRSVWLYMPIEEGDHITNIWLRKSFSKSNCLVFRTKNGRMHMMGTYPDEGWTGGLYVTWAAGLTPDDYILFDDSPKRIQGIAVPARIPKGKDNDAPLILQDPASRRPRWESRESFLSIASMENIVSFRTCHRRVVKTLCLVGILFEYQDGHKEVVGQIRPDKLGKTIQVTESAEAIWLFSLNGIYVRTSLARESKANETAVEIPLRGQIEWWFVAHGAFAQHVETEALSEPEPIRTFVDDEDEEEEEEDWEEQLVGKRPDYSIHDPDLTELGKSQCLKLRESLKSRFGDVSADDIAVVVSPMKRTLQTATLALDWLLEKGIRFEANADWQENGVTPCDTGSELTDSFKAPYPHVDFSSVDPVWPDKTSDAAKKYYCTRQAVVERGRQCLEGLHERKEKIIFVVSHSGLLRVGITRSRYTNADYRIFEFDGTERENGRWTITQDPTTLEGGLGSSSTETVELGEGLDDE